MPRLKQAMLLSIAEQDRTGLIVFVRAGTHVDLFGEQIVDYGAGFPFPDGNCRAASTALGFLPGNTSTRFAVGTFSVTSKGQVTIPKAVRQKLGIRTGSQVRFSIVGDRVELARVDAHAPVSESGAAMLRRKRAAVPADFDVASLLRPRRDGR